MSNTVTITDIRLENKKLYMSINAEIEGEKTLSMPKLKFYFNTDGEDRILPIVIEEGKYEDETWHLYGSFVYELNNIFWKKQSKTQDFNGYIYQFDGSENFKAIKLDIETKNIENEFYKITFNDSSFNIKIDNKNKPVDSKKTMKMLQRTVALIYYWLWNIVEFIPRIFGKVPFSANRGSIFHKCSEYSKRIVIKKLYEKYSKETIVNNQILFLSQRSDKLEGNLKIVYDEMSKLDNYRVEILLDTTFLYDMTYKKMKNFAKLCAKSSIIIADEYVPQLYVFDIRNQSKVVQLWHACGAFKTFGFSRLGKPDGSKQKSRVHRNYDLAIVSSESIRQCYAEGFGIPLDYVVATGVPRTDLLFDEIYKRSKVEELYKKYPVLKGKKVVLFAPTFRGTVKENAYYPMDKFNIKNLMVNLGDEYVLLIKHHPFVTEEVKIPNDLKDRVIDVKNYPEINDLLLITDVLITDYSSVIFEGAILNKKMVFYVFDLEEYIKERDFYFDFKEFIPGSVVKTEKELIEAINDEEFDRNNLEIFKSKYIDACDGNATKRVVDLIRELN